MANYMEMASSTDVEWIEILCKEYQEEGKEYKHIDLILDDFLKEYARWPVLLLQSNARRLVWAISGVLGVGAKGVPGSSCRLLEQYISRKIELFFQQSRISSIMTDTEEWDAYKTRLAGRFVLLAVSCIQLTAKMQDLMAPLTATLVRSALLKEGIDLSREDIVAMEFHVFRTISGAGAAVNFGGSRADNKYNGILSGRVGVTDEGLGDSQPEWKPGINGLKTQSRQCDYPQLAHVRGGCIGDGSLLSLTVYRPCPSHGHLNQISPSLFKSYFRLCF
ncbi:hypothetical protein HF086_004474 [Spodoptera exigua]|uniref:Uncharacterized protein n=1 Tax=Spodoptera exigua TaxID=7107 RepID=A0A922M4L1_SPOEX|nr:hypothetical protein HF086_004474 [Spodoptera exigua]